MVGMHNIMQALRNAVLCVICKMLPCPRFARQAEWPLHNNAPSTAISLQITNGLRVRDCACAGDVLDVALSEDGVLGASCSDDFSVRVWDLEHRECLKTCKGHTGWVVSVQVGHRFAGERGGPLLSMALGNAITSLVQLCQRDNSGVAVR